jgi:outer membrane protein assembly factor BamB
VKNQWVAITAWFGVIMGSTFSAFAGESVSFQINPHHTGAAIFDGGLKLPLQQLWTRNMHGLVTYPLIAEGNVFVSVGNVGTYGSVFYALNEKTGETIWSQAIPGTFFTSLAVYDNGNVFVLNYDGVLRALQASTGTLLWKVQIPGQYVFDAPPTARDGMIFIGGAGTGVTIYAVREKDGSIAWSQGAVAGNWSAPTLSEDGVFVSYPCQAYEFDIVTGALRWNYNGGCDGGGGVTTALYDQVLFTSDLISANPGTGNALLAFNGTQIGTLGNLSSSLAYQRGVGFSYPPALQAGMGYFVKDSHGLVARGVPGFGVKWSFGGDNTISPAAIVVNGHVIAASNAGHLYVLDGATGTLQQTLTLPASSQIGEGGVPNGLAAGDELIAVPYLQTLTAYAGSP